MQKHAKDAIYSQPQHISDFRFDENVADVFADMIQRSIPGYSTIVDAIGQLAGQYQQANSQFYDLGCSLGACTLAMRRYINADNAKIVAIDNSPSMVERCQRHVANYKGDAAIDVRLGDIQQTPIENAAVVVMNFTLQFVEPTQRQAIVNRIYQGLKPGGILILSEKIKHPGETGNELLIELHHEFKRRNGYSELEISQKRTALENVMKTDSFETHQQRLTEAGFDDVILWFKCFNFCSMVAIKGHQG